MAGEMDVKMEKQMVVQQQNVSKVGTTKSGNDVNIADELVNSAEEPKTDNPEKPLKTTDLDFSQFSKNERKFAGDKARDALNEVRDLARTFNSDFPAMPYVIPYEDFPKPEASVAQFGKRDGYEQWTKDVTDWVEDCKQDMNELRNTNLNDLMSEFNAKVDRNFIALCEGFGITLAEMKSMFEEAKGDMAKFNQLIINARNAIINNTNRNAADLHEHINIAEGSIHSHIEHSEDVLNDEIHDSESRINRKIENVDNHITDIEENNEEMRNLKEYIGQCWQNNPVQTQYTLTHYYHKQGKVLDGFGGILQPTGAVQLSDRDNNAYQTIIENMSLDELRELSNMLKNNPLIHH